MKYLLFIILVFLGCGESSTTEIPAKANVEKVIANGLENSYNFAVTINSDETGCDQYADWWEVIKADGTLVYRRILFHSHPSEQPFTRLGGGVSILKDDKVYIRAHLNNKGYGGDVFVGSIKDGFTLATTVPEFSKDIESLKPLPNGCAF